MREDLFVYGRDNERARAHFSRRQLGRCAICDTKSPRLVVDHEHSDEGLVRGLLCDPCNTALGMFRDDPEALRRAADYLSDHDGRNVAYRETEDWRGRRLRVIRPALDDLAVARRDKAIVEYANEGHSAKTIAHRFEIHPSTVYRIVGEHDGANAA